MKKISNAAIAHIAKLNIYQNNKLIGLDKIRESLVTDAALAGTGFAEVTGSAIPGAAGAGNHELQLIVDGVFAETVEKIRSKLVEVPA